MLEDMLRACAIDFGGSWDRYLPLAEFSYNNESVLVLARHDFGYCMVGSVGRLFVGARLASESWVARR